MMQPGKQHDATQTIPTADLEYAEPAATLQKKIHIKSLS